MSEENTTGQRNALARLAETLKHRVEHNGYVYVYGINRQEDIIVQRIIEALAKVQIADGMARRMTPRANCLDYRIGKEPPQTVGIFTTEHFPKWICSAINAVEECRELAEEAVTK